MYCYHCGNLVYNGMSRCQFCGSETQVIRELIYDSKIEKIAQNIPQFDNTDEVFHLGNVETNAVIIPAKNTLVTTLNKFSSCVYEAAWKELFEWITRYPFDAIIEKGAEKLESLMVATELAGAALMKKMGCNIDSHTIEEKLSYDRKYILMQDPLYDLKEVHGALQDVKEESFENIVKKYKTQKSSRWVGGGFGVAGAIKGSITAGVMNLGETAIQGIFNSIGSFAEKSEIKRKLEKIKDTIHESFEFQYFFKSLLRDYMKGFHRTLKGAIISELQIDNLSIDYSWGENLEYDLSICDKQSAIDRLNDNIYDLNAYINLYIINRRYGKELCRIADYCGILDIVESAFLQHEDGKMIANMDLNKLGYDISDHELLTFKKNVDELEENNSIFQNTYEDTYKYFLTAEAHKYSIDINNLPCEKVESFCEEYKGDVSTPNEYKLMFYKKLVKKEQEYSKKLNELCSTIEIKKSKYSKYRILKIKEKIVNKNMADICKIENICSMDQEIILKIILLINSISSSNDKFKIAVLRNHLYAIFKSISEEKEEAFKFFTDYIVDNASKLSSDIVLECVIGRKCWLYANNNEDGTIDKNKLTYIEQAVKEGNIFAMSIIGNFYLSTKSQKDLGIKFIEKASQCLEITSLKEIENWYECGINGYPKNEEKAEQYFLISFIMGCEEAEEKFLELYQK